MEVEWEGNRRHQGSRRDTYFPEGTRLQQLFQSPDTLMTKGNPVTWL